MDGLECYAVQATKQQYLKLDQNNCSKLDQNIILLSYVALKHKNM